MAAKQLEALAEQTEAFYRERISAVAELRRGGLSYDSIGKALKVNRQRAAQLYRDAVTRGLVADDDHLERARPRR